MSRMIRRLAIAAVLCGILGGAFATPSEAKTPCGRCTVIGEGEATVEATGCCVRFTVESGGASAEEARKKSEEILMQIRKATAKAGTVREESFRLSECESAVATRQCVCAVKDPKAVEDVRRALEKAGAVGVYEAWFTAEETEEARKTAAARALEDAKGKAEALGIGGTVLSVREIPAECCPMPLAREMGGSAPTLTVQIRLLVSFGTEVDMQKTVDIPREQILPVGH